jgi:type IV pilus assembly protein PilM
LTLPGRKSPVGLDVGGRAVAAVQLVRTRTGWKIEAATVIARPVGAEPVPTAEEARRIGDVLFRQGFSGRRVVVAAPDARVLSGTMDLPPRGSGAPIEQLARAELGRMHRRDTSSLEVACWDVPVPARSTSGTYMMAAACPRAEIEALIDNLESAGLRPAAVDIRAWAMARACAPLLRGSANVSAILDLGESEAVLSVVREGTVVYERLMTDAGLSRVRLRARQELDLEGELADYVIDTIGLAGVPADYQGDKAVLAEVGELLHEHCAALTQELRTAMAYAVHRYPGEVDSVLAHGSGATVPGLVEVMSGGIGAEIRRVTPELLAACPRTLGPRASDPALTSALGLALHGEGRAA